MAWAWQKLPYARSYYVLTFIGVEVGFHQPRLKNWTSLPTRSAISSIPAMITGLAQKNEKQMQKDRASNFFDKPYSMLRKGA
jgi:hypothetical protein